MNETVPFFPRTYIPTPGAIPGAKAMATAIRASATATDRLASRLHGSIFSRAMNAPTTAIRAAFQDIKVKTMEPWLTDGNLEACHVILTGTHRGDMAGVPASGNSVEFGGTDIIRVEDGKVAEHWGSTDTMSLMQQIGAIPQ